MYAVDLSASRVALRERLIDSYAEGGIFVPGSFDVTSGSLVLVRVGLEGLPCGVIMEGVVQWRRTAVAARQATPPGTGVRFLPSCQERSRFLFSWAAGLHHGSGRVDWRYPLELPVTLTTKLKGSTRIYPCSVRDVSAYGAMVTVNARLTTDEVFRMEWRNAEKVQAVTARVVWTAGGRAGLRVLFDGREERPAWEALVDAARTAFNAMVVPPRAAR